MRFGTFTVQSVGPGADPGEAVGDYFEQALAAERAGFYEVWLAEHNGRRYGMAGNVVVPAAAIRSQGSPPWSPILPEPGRPGPA
jgi:alkanesulfonate monooxygenase SsuD/methylene tetrahydromethanopterin reductase-like flavin-dependent oxidoreductase (luciferase family)